MGKSTTAKLFADEGCAVWDADAAVHRLYGVGGDGVAAIKAFYPPAIVDGTVSREVLKAWIAKDPSALPRIEAVIHPLVAADRQEFLRHTDAQIAVLDIPLLFEGGAPVGLDLIVVVSAPMDVQKERVLARPGMTEARFHAMLAKQMPDAEKRRRADKVIETTTIEHAQNAVRAILAEVRQQHA